MDPALRQTLTCELHAGPTSRLVCVGRPAVGEEAERLRNDLQDAQDNAKTASKEVKDLKGKESGAKEERDVLNTDVQSQTKDKTRYV